MKNDDDDVLRRVETAYSDVSDGITDRKKRGRANDEAKTGMAGRNARKSKECREYQGLGPGERARARRGGKEDRLDLCHQNGVPFDVFHCLDCEGGIGNAFEGSDALGAHARSRGGLDLAHVHEMSPLNNRNKG